MPAPTALTGREVWFLTGSQRLYGAETLRQVAAQSQAIADVLAGSPDIPVHVVWQPVLTGPDEIRRMILTANEDDAVLGVIAWMHTFSPAKMWIAGLTALAKPLLHLHTQANVALPWSTLDFDFMNLNQAAHGDREFGYIQTRLALRRKTVVGHVSDAHVVAQVATWIRAAVGWAATRSLRLARFGDNMRFVAVTEGDKTEAEAVFGVQVNTWSVNDLADAIGDVSPAEVSSLVEEYQDTYDVAPELRIGKERHQALRDGAAIELGLRSFLDAGGFGAFTTNFEDLGALKQLPGLAVQRLMAGGYGFGAEGDWKTAVLVRAAKAAYAVAERSGVAALTLDAVAAEAKVSKGGLLYHFPSKEALVAGMVDGLCRTCRDLAAAAAQADPEPLGRSARAYLAACAGDLWHSSRWTALVGALVVNPELLEAWRADVLAGRAADEEEGVDPTAAEIVRLAADGMWVGEILGLPGPGRELKAKVLAELNQLTGGRRPPGP